VATVVVNSLNHIEFRNVNAAKAQNDSPTVSFQAGEWAAENHVEAGIVVDVYGPEAPILTSADARKLAKWLNRAADELEGTHKKNNKHKQRRHYESDDDNTY
jgi:hypothetical protein